MIPLAILHNNKKMRLIRMPIRRDQRGRKVAESNLHMQIMLLIILAPRERERKKEREHYV